MLILSSVSAIDRHVSLPGVVGNAYSWISFPHFLPGSSLLWPITEIYRGRPDESIDTFPHPLLTAVGIDRPRAEDIDGDGD